MPINAITAQPVQNSINAAYRPVILTVTTSGTVPVVYCDIYINAVFYKTLSKSVNNQGFWQFDIQDAAQEVLRHYRPDYASSNVLAADSLAAGVWCRFRASTIDSNGFIVPDGTAPIQATGSTPATSGDGEQSNDFYIVNATLQNEDSQDLATHLNSKKVGMWNAGAFPLTQRPDNYMICKTDSDFFPIINTQGIYGINVIRLQYKTQGGAAYLTSDASVTMPAGIVFYIPSGPIQLAPLFPDVDFYKVQSYYLQGISTNNLASPVFMETGVFTISGCCAEDKKRIVFINGLGAMDAINFKLQTKDHDVKADAYESPIPYPLVKETHTTGRFNIRSNNTVTAVCTEYGEDQMDWINELFDTPAAWEETIYSYIPIVILNATTQNVKVDERYDYQIALQYKPSHTKINLRN